VRLSYELLTEFQKKYIISEAFHFILNYAFKDLNLTKIEVFAGRKNLNSFKLIQKFQSILNENRTYEKYSQDIIFDVA